MITQRLLQNPALEGNEKGVANMSSSKEESMLRTIEMMDKEFGGAERYVKDVVGLTDEQVSMVRRNMVVERAAVL